MAGVKGRSGRKRGFKHDPAVKTRIAISCWALWQDREYRALNLPKIMASHPKAVRPLPWFVRHAPPSDVFPLKYELQSRPDRPIFDRTKSTKEPVMCGARTEAELDAAHAREQRIKRALTPPGVADTTEAIRFCSCDPLALRLKVRQPRRTPALTPTVPAIRRRAQRVMAHA